MVGGLRKKMCQLEDRKFRFLPFWLLLVEKTEDLGGSRGFRRRRMIGKRIIPVFIAPRRRKGDVCWVIDVVCVEPRIQLFIDLPL